MSKEDGPTDAIPPATAPGIGRCNDTSWELHDCVIQRLYAAGLNIAAVLAEATEPETVRRLNEVIDELDIAIRELGPDFSS